MSSRLYLRDVALNTYKSCNAKRTEVAKVRSAAKPHLVRRKIVGVGGGRETIAYVDSENDGFSPKTWWE